MIKNNGKLIDWSADKEKKYQIEIAKIKSGKPVYRDGKIVLEELKESNYPDELKALIKERDKISRRIPEVKFTKKEREQNERALNEMIRKGLLNPIQ